MAKKILLLIFSFGLFLGSAYGQENGGRGDRYDREPTVSRQEAKILEQAVALAEDDREAAIKLLLEETDDNSSAALDFALGSFYFQKDKPADAEAAYRRALAKFPSFDRARANLARILIKEDRIDEALNELKEILLSGTARPSTLTMIGYTSLLKEEPVPAEMAYRQALLIDPEDSNAYSGLVKSLLMQERYREAVTLLEDLLEDDPFRSEFWFLLANARLALDEPDRAIIALECTRRLKVASDESLATLADLYLNGGYPEEALSRYREAFAGKEPSIDRMLRAGKAFILTRDPNRAEVLLKRIRDAAGGDGFDLTPDQSRELNRLEAGRSHLEGDIDGALRAYQQLLDDDPLDGEVLLALGDLAREKRDLEEAIIFYEQASRITDTRLNAFIRHAQLEVERGRYGPAVELLEKALRVKPQPHVAGYLEQVRRLVR
jgi:tetratricopeptide (TPR) repeat protein